MEDGIRQEVTDAIKTILSLILELITAPSAGPTTQAAFKALRSIGISLQPGEELIVTNALPPVLNAIKQQTLAAPEALSTLVPLSSVFFHLGRLSVLTSL